MDQLDVKVTLNPKQLYHFNLYHCYHSFNGIFGIVLGIVCIAYAIVFRTQIDISRFVILIGLGVIFWVYNPISLYMRSKSRFLSSESLKLPMNYHFAKSGIILSQNDISEEMKWESIYKVVETKESLLIYLTARHANVIPKESLGEQYSNVCEMIKKYATSSIVKLVG